tara:strand:- start:1048 stop:1797 length:750 start_codon:yes stop_codon:yes gene_type:complete
MSRDFDLESYGEMISTIKKLGYKIVFFEDLDVQDTHLLLRHDVDISLESALKMAIYEANQKFYSTYFILLRSEMYNIYSSYATEIIKKILSLGHRIGLHFDNSIYTDKDSNSIDKNCEKECFALQSWFDIDITAISFHQPSKYEISLDKKISGRINTYQSLYFKRILYCSDSRGDWYYGHPLKSLMEKSNQAIQLLTHPIWWDTKSKIDPEIRLKKFALEHIRSFCNNLTISTEVFKNEKLLDHIDKLD